MSTLAERIEELIADYESDGKKFKQVDLARACGIASPSVSDWRSGKTKNLEGANLLRAAEFFGAMPRWLAEGKGPKRKPPAQTISPKGFDAYRSGALRAEREYPLISSVRAGRWHEIRDNYELGDGERFIKSSYIGGRAFFLRVDGDSMEPTFELGDLILVDPDKAALAGDFVVAKDTGTQEATFKKLTYDGGRYFLKPENRQYQAIEIDDPAIRIIGRVVRHVKKEREL